MMTATLHSVKMAACLQQDGDSSDPDNSGPSSLSQFLKQQSSGIQVGALNSSDTPETIKLKGDKAYDEVLKYQEDELRNLLEEVTNAGKRKDKSSLSPHALALIQKEQDALREESSSGDDTRDLIQRCRNKKFLGRRHQSSGDQQSAAACTSTGGSLGSLHDLSETKQPKKVAGPNQGVASRCREGGSCGNLSRGSFETQPPRKKKGRRCRDAARASASQREGGSLQNLSKTEAASSDSKKLHKSGSLSHVCSEVNSGARSKNRRQKTASESSSSKYPRHLEDRERGDDSSEDEDNNCVRPKHQVPLGSEGVFPPEGVGGASGGIRPDPSHTHDSVSDVASEGESTDEEIDPRVFTGRKCSNIPIEKNGIELQTVKCHRSEFEFDKIHTEVDKEINFSLSRSQGDTMLGSGHRTLLLQNSQSVTSVFKEEKSSNKCTEEENSCKRKLTGNKSEMGSCENKASLDENGNPVMSTSSGSTNPTVLAGERPSTVLQTTSRKNVINLKDASRFDRVKARNDKKKANREKDIVNISETPGFCGDQDLNDILKFLGADVDNTNVKNRKKHKGKKEDCKDDKEIKKKCKNTDKACEEGVDKTNKNEEGRYKIDDESSNSLGDAARENMRKSKEKEEEKKSSKKNKNDSKKTKKNPGTLRESSSMEDLVSKSKQSDSVRDIRKQVTVDDGNMALSSLNTYHSNKKDKFDNLLKNRSFIKETELDSVDNDADHKKSDFVADFYSVGDSFLTADIPLSPSSPAGGDFEVVGSKKKGKRSKNGYQNSKSFECDRFSGNSNFSGSAHGEEGFRGSRFGHAKPGHHYNGSFERPHINFVEVPRTAHENTFIAQWSHLGVGDRYGAERYTVTTTSAPHSEDSGSDGDDSVHSMPVPSITPRPDVRKPPPSSDSTPQTSYANIAKLAATANRAQMKRMMTSSSVQTGTTTLRELEGEPLLSENAEITETRLPSVNESRPTNILDDNFPSLAESLGCISCPSAMSHVKTNESRTNQLSESSTGQSGYAGITESNDQCKESFESESIAIQKEAVNLLMPDKKTTMEKSPKLPSELVKPMQSHVVQDNDSQTPDAQQKHLTQEQHNHQPVKHQGHTSVFYQKTATHMSHPPSHQSTQQQSSYSSNTSEQNTQKMISQEVVTLPQKSLSAASLPQEHSHHTASPHPPQHTSLVSQHITPKQYSQASQQSQLAYLSHSNAGIQSNVAVLSIQPQHHVSSHSSSQPPTLAQHQKAGSNQQVVQPQSGPNKEKVSPSQQNMSIHLNSHSKLTQHSQKNPHAQEGQPTHSHTQMEQTPPVELNSVVKPVKPQSDNPGPESGGSDDRQPYYNRKSQNKQTRNGPAGLSVQSSDTSRGKKLEPAVVFTDNAKFNHRVSGIEFGFGFDEPIVTTSDNDDGVSESLEDNLNCNINNNNNILNNHTVTKDFSKWFKAPKNDKISYNYEELIKHVSKAWEVTLQLMEKDPKNIQYWKAAESREEA
ncbi:uncharacterized protein LOC123504292 [Portunus trituberculatus]|uniref:uncharacterized protein LOC123504292 n=1 Tax=Portunus trituberculatus TaxID=210409 RepID=UPI001E1CCCEC|nr:uncharacterized protein LOC123504292 [Portunus trituberculatus]